MFLLPLEHTVINIFLREFTVLTSEQYFGGAAKILGGESEKPFQVQPRLYMTMIKTWLCNWKMSD